STMPAPSRSLTKSPRNRRRPTRRPSPKRRPVRWCPSSLALVRIAAALLGLWLPMMFWAVAVQASTPTNHTCAANPRWSVRLAWIAAELEQARVAFEASLARGARLEVQAQRAVIESEQWILDGDV